MSLMETDERVTEIEIKLVYQEQLIKELDTYVRTLGEKLDATARELEKLKASLRSPEGPMGPANEKPPHY